MTSRRSALLKIISVILVLACVAFILASPLNYSGVTYAAAASDSKVQGYEDQIKNLQKEQKELEKQIQEAKKDAENFLKEKEALDKQIENLSKQIIVANDLLIEYNNAVIAKEEEIVNKQSEYDTKFEQFKDRLRVSYEDGSVGYLAMLFSSESIADFLTSIERMTNMLDYDKRTMKNLNEEKADLTVEKEELEALRAGQQKAYDDLKTNEETLKTKSSQAANYYQQEIKNEAELEKKIKKLQDEEKKANAELDKYLAELAKKNNGVYTGGAFSWPLPQNQNKITSKYGNRTYKIWGKTVTDFHRGIDISVPTGTNVLACADGTVNIAGWSNSYGYYVVISHGSGYTTLYAHNSSLSVKVGDKVITSKYTGTEVKCDGVEYSIVRQGDILAIVE